jgi:hypothetical protein
MGEVIQRSTCQDHIVPRFILISHFKGVVHDVKLVPRVGKGGSR